MLDCLRKLPEGASDEQADQSTCVAAIVLSATWKLFSFPSALLAC
jgi:hypothetical protein